MVHEHYNMRSLKKTIEEINRMGKSATDPEVRNILFSAQDYLETFEQESENTALSWKTILECKDQEKAKRQGK